MRIGNRTQIEAVFSDLEERGIIARGDFWCCNSCASSALVSRELPMYRERLGAEHQPIGYVFFHEQSTDSANQGGPLYLAHGSISEAHDDPDSEQVGFDQRLVGRIVIDEFREHGFEAEWSGNLAEKILILEPQGGWELNYDRPDQDDEVLDGWDADLRDED